MPSYKTKQVDDNGKDVYRDICYPVTKNFRETLYKAILEEYGNRKDRSEDDFAEYIEQQKLEAASPEKKTEEKSETKSEDKDSDKKNSPNGKESKGKSSKEKR